MSNAAAYVPRKLALSSKKVAEKLIAFAEDLTRKDENDPGKKMYPSQRETAGAIIVAVLDGTGETITALFCRQSGKTETVAQVALAMALLLPELAAEFPDDPRFRKFRHGCRIGIYGPIQEKAQLPFNRISDYAKTDWAEERFAELGVQKTISRGNTVAWTNGSIISAKTASPAVNNEGDTWHVMFVEESQLIGTKKLDKELLPTLTSTNGPCVLIGTAGGARGAFYEKCKTNIEDERATGKRKHFEFNWRDIDAERTAAYEKESTKYAKYLAMSPPERAKAANDNPLVALPPNEDHLAYGKSTRERIRTTKGGEQNEEFRQNYLLEWVDSRSIALSDEEIRRAADVSVELNSPRSHGRIAVVAGLDLAKGGEKRDQTVLSFVAVDPVPAFDPVALPAGPQVPLWNKTVVGLYTAAGDFELTQAGIIVETMLQWSHVCRVLVVDANGLGRFLITRLQALLYWVNVIPFESADEGMKAEAYTAYVSDWQARRIRYAASPRSRAIPEYKEFVEQHQTLQKRPSRRGGITCEAEEGEHDDHPDSVSMACTAAGQALADVAGFEIEVQPSSTRFSARQRARAARQAPPQLGVSPEQAAYDALANVGGAAQRRRR